MGTIIFIPHPKFPPINLSPSNTLFTFVSERYLKLCRTMQSVAELPLLYRYQILLEGFLILCLKKQKQLFPFTEIGYLRHEGTGTCGHRTSGHPLPEW